MVCHGNILRSPFAEAALNHRLKASGHAMEVTSAGMLPLIGRSVPGQAQTIAQSFGVDLSTHRSRHLTPDMLDKNALLVVFDARNQEDICRRYPHASGSIIHLADFESATAGDGEIDDPWGQGGDVVQNTYARIEDAVSGLAEALRPR